MFTSPGITPDISDSVEMREAEGAEGGAEVEAVTRITNSQEETGTEDKENDQDVILGHRNSPDAMSVDEGREETMKKDEEGKTGADEREMESETRTPAIQVDVKVDYSKQKTFGDDQRFNQGSNKSHEEQEELGTDVRQSAGQEKETENYMKRRSQRESQLKQSDNLKLEKSGEKAGKKMEKKKGKKGKQNIKQEPFKKKKERTCNLFCGTRGMTSDSD